MQTPIPVHFDQVFRHKAYLTSEVEPIYAFVDGQRGPQEMHPVTGDPMWQVTVLDADPNAKGAAKSVKVKISSKYQPVPPAPADGSPFAEVEFVDMAITPYVVEVMKGRPRVAYSLQARGFATPTTTATPGSKRAAEVGV
jgi:hypothetical protein